MSLRPQKRKPEYEDGLAEAETGLPYRSGQTGKNCLARFLCAPGKGICREMESEGRQILKRSIINEKLAQAGYFDFPALYEQLRNLYLCD